MELRFCKNIIKKISQTETDEHIKLVLCVKHRTYNAQLFINGKHYSDAFNIEEPYDLLTHVFYIPKTEIKEQNDLCFSAELIKNSGIRFSRSFRFVCSPLSDKNMLLKEYDHDLVLLQKDTEELCEGVTYIHKLYLDRNSDPVHVYITKADPAYSSLYIGTPDDGYEKVNVRASIPDMIQSACNSGHNIIAGVNADFFDIFGDFHPSGLCIKNGKIISDPKNGRAFIAMLKSGEYIITDDNESPGIKNDIIQAAAGFQMIIKDGQIFDFAPNEPFSYVRHPRTGAGICKDGTLLLFAVDGRIPEHSNGASLVDLAKLMIEEGADRAINMDGGGSTAMYTKSDKDFILRNRPADLFRPKANLIRKDFNSLLIEKK